MLGVSKPPPSPKREQIPGTLCLLHVGIEALLLLVAMAGRSAGQGEVSPGRSHSAHPWVLPHWHLEEVSCPHSSEDQHLMDTSCLGVWPSSP